VAFIVFVWQNGQAKPSWRNSISATIKSAYTAQQCAGKYLKARLVEVTPAFQKAYDLEEFLDLALPLESLWSALHPSSKIE
jgi:hypothetical protein